MLPPVKLSSHSVKPKPQCQSHRIRKENVCTFLPYSQLSHAILLVGDHLDGLLPPLVSSFTVNIYKRSESGYGTANQPKPIPGTPTNTKREDNGTQ